MKVIANLALICGVLLTTGCQNESPKDNIKMVSQLQTPIIIDIEQDFKKEKELRLSEIAHDIEYIKLETTPESIVGGGIPTWYLTKEYIFVFSKGRLLQFNRNGKYIKQIGKKGRGPGEFLVIRGLALDELSSTLYLISNYKAKVLKYDVNSGDFLGGFSISRDLGSIMLMRPFQIIGNNKFAILSHPLNQFNPNYELLEIIDNNGHVLTKIGSSLFSIQDDTNVKRVKPGSNKIWLFQDTIRLFESLNDTIYNVKNNKLETAYIINLGKYKGPFDLMTTKYYNEINNYVQLFSIWETPKYFFIGFFFNGKLHNGLFDKINGEFCRITETSGNTGAIANDIDGGLSFRPNYSVEQADNEWVYCIDAINLKRKLTNEYLQASEAKYPEKKEILRKFMNELSIEDNPVVVIAKLK